MDRIMSMSYCCLKEYVSFRERQVNKNEVYVDEAEIRAIERRLDELRRDGYCTALKYAVINSQLRTIKRWNRDNRVNNEIDQ